MFGSRRVAFCGCWYVIPIAPSQKQYLPQVELKSTTTILSCTAKTTLVQKFANNHSDSIPEAQYTFPLYDGVSVVSFKCVIGDRTIVGVVKEKQQARADYKAAIDRGETAGLLEQMEEASDVFSTEIGNIAPNQEVSVEIVYLGELKHDTETDGIRFTIPTTIAPRYGSISQDMNQSMFGFDKVRNSRGMDIQVEIEMEEGSAIRGVQSPSHPIAVTLGRHSTHDEERFENHLASATLSVLGKVELDKDFIIVVNAKGQDTPRAFYETHSTLEGHRALMATLVPKFSLPNANPEIVFVVDRSGSMGGKIPTVVQAMKVFLKSLPMSVKFNICSFGSHHSLLFTKSKPYDSASLNKALKHLESFDSNYGGTEMLLPIQACVKNRLKGTPLELLVLTDGEIWNQQELFDYINEAAKEKVRVFSLGIDDAASSALVEGMARAGNGFSQFVHDGEKMDKRVIRMLKATLTPVISDYALEVKYAADETSDGAEDDFEIVESFTESMKTVVGEIDEQTKTKKVISLFTPGFKEDKSVKGPEGRYDHLPPVATPKVLQAPHQISQLYAFTRTTVYLLFGPNSCQKKPQKVILRGTSEHGPLELEIPVQDVGNGEMVHQLGAKKAIQELEEGRGWLAESKTADGKLLKTKFEGDWQRIVEREAVRLGTTYQVGSKYCSFVAVDPKAKPEEHEMTLKADQGQKSERLRTRDEHFRRLPRASAPRGNFANPASSSLFGAASPPSPAVASSCVGSSQSVFSPQYSQSFAPSGSLSETTLAQQIMPAFAPSRGFFGRAAAAPSSSFSRSAAPSGSLFGRVFGSTAAPTAGGLFGSAPLAATDARRAVPEKKRKSKMSTRSEVQPAMKEAKTEEAEDDEDNDEMLLILQAENQDQAQADTGAAYSKHSVSATTNNPMTTESIMHDIIDLQEFDGSWTKIDNLLSATGMDKQKFNNAMTFIVSDAVKATAYALAWLESKAAKEKDTWEMVADKARSWLASHGNYDDAEILIGMAKDEFF